MSLLPPSEVLSFSVVCACYFYVLRQLAGSGKQPIEVSVLYPKQWTVTKTPGACSFVSGRGIRRGGGCRRAR